MAEYSGADPLALRAFRRTGQADAKTADGEELRGKGVVSALRRGAAQAGGTPHPLGTLPRPLYRFVGYLPGLENAVGGELTQGGQTYRILDVRKILLGQRELCVRALLERKEGE